MAFLFVILCVVAGVGMGWGAGAKPVKQCRYCLKLKRKCKHHEKCSPELKYVLEKSGSLWVCPDCFSAEGVERITADAKKAKKYRLDKSLPTHVKVQLSQHCHNLVRYGWTIIPNAIHHNRCDAARTELNKPMAWNPLFNGNVTIKAKKERQIRDLPTGGVFEELKEEIMEEVHEALKGWAPVSARKWTTIRTCEGSPMQHRHSDWDPVHMKGFTLISRPLSLIGSFSLARLRVWNVEEYGTAHVRCDCICQKNGKRKCPPAQGGEVVQLNKGGVIIFVGDLLHAGTEGFEGSLEHPRFHVYLHTSSAEEEPAEETFPCGVIGTDANRP